MCALILANIELILQNPLRINRGAIGPYIRAGKRLVRISRIGEPHRIDGRVVTLDGRLARTVEDTELSRNMVLIDTSL